MATQPKNRVNVQTTPRESGAFDPEPNTLIIEDQSLRYGFVHLPKVILYARNLSASAKLLYAVLLIDKVFKHHTIGVWHEDNFN